MQLWVQALTVLLFTCLAPMTVSISITIISWVQNLSWSSLKLCLTALQ